MNSIATLEKFVFPPETSSDTQNLHDTRTVPDDSAYWDDGDWIDWYRNPTGVGQTPLELVPQDPMSQKTALHDDLLRSAKAYFRISGKHLPVYDQIANIHAAIYCDLPIAAPSEVLVETGVKLVCLPPGDEVVPMTIDMPELANTLLVVRIKDDFTVEARMSPRTTLKMNPEGRCTFHWQDLAHKFGSQAGFGLTGTCGM